MKKKVLLDIFQEAVLPMLESKHADTAQLQKAIDDGYEIYELDKDGKESAVQFKVAAAAKVEPKNDDADIQAKIDKALADKQDKANKDNPGRVIVGNDKREEDPQRGFKNLGEFGQAIYLGGTQGGQVDERLRVIKSMTKAVSGMSIASGPDAGYLVPPAFSTTIWEGINRDSDSLIGMTDSLPLQTGNDSITVLANAETSRANGSRWGGIQGYWRAEADQMTASKPKLREVMLKPHELYGFAYATNNLLRQAATLTQYLSRVITDELSFKIGDSIVNGTGAGQPLGILNSAAKVEVSKETGQAAATIVYNNLIKMLARLHPKARARAVWLHNVDIEPSLQQMNMPVGTGGVPVYLPPGGAAEAPHSRLLGRPMYPVEYCATLGTVGDLILWDPMGYVTVTRSEGVISDTSIHLRFDYGETAFRFTTEVGGQPWLASAITPFKGTATLTNIVTLATRA
ncbi:MAG TPA: phage major capsid protein [Prosthecobacter sp.]|nr:phage major capsid protein [Prosthecobacter sp.]